ncbi:MAG: class II histone deacetylase [Chloroflexia bacterium]|nr:class II histone deacetylase [Chloroflexia bacterium]
MSDNRDRRVGLVFDDRYLSHSAGEWLINYRERYPFADPVPHISSPAIPARAKHLMDLYGISDAMTRIEPYEADDAALGAYHTPEHLARVATVAQAGGDTGTGAPIGRGGDRVARLSAGGVLAAVDAVMRGDVGRAFALTRPPGHHAMADQGMGFCVFANVAVAAHHARRHHRAERIAILDWDVHHGNGTQDAFFADPSVLFISMHQEDLFPVGWGALDQTGEGAGEGSTVNIPLPAGAGNPTYLAVIDRIVEPVLRQFRPDLVFISAGQDASVLDPLGRMSLTVDSYRTMTQRLLALAEELCGGRLVVALEGGYSEVYAPYCTAVIAEALCAGMPGITPVEDPYGARSGSQPASQRIGLEARAAIEAAVAVAGRYWTL